MNRSLKLRGLLPLAASMGLAAYLWMRECPYEKMRA